MHGKWAVVMQNNLLELSYDSGSFFSLEVTIPMQTLCSDGSSIGSRNMLSFRRPHINDIWG